MRRRVLFVILFVPALMLCAMLLSRRPAALARAVGDGQKVYLFGTVHILNEKVQWRSPELEAAIAQSQDLYLEIANADDSREAVAAMFKLGIDRDHPLSSELPKS